MQLFKAFWRIKVLTSTYFVAWRLLENKIATKANLVSRGTAVGNIMRSLCVGKEETSSHLFFWLSIRLVSVESLLCVARAEFDLSFLTFIPISCSLTCVMHLILLIWSWRMFGLQWLARSGVLGTRSSLEVEWWIIQRLSPWVN